MDSALNAGFILFLPLGCSRFFTGALAFLAGAFLAAVFFLAGAFFLAAAFLAAGLLAAAFFAAGRLAADLFTAFFLAGAFLVAAFFAGFFLQPIWLTLSFSLLPSLRLPFLQEPSLPSSLSSTYPRGDSFQLDIGTLCTFVFFLLHHKRNFPVTIIGIFDR